MDTISLLSCDFSGEARACMVYFSQFARFGVTKEAHIGCWLRTGPALLASMLSNASRVHPCTRVPGI